MKQPLLVLIAATVAASVLSACGGPRMPLMGMRAPMRYMAANRYTAVGNVHGSLTPTRPKEESKLVDRKVEVARSAFDDFGDRQRNRRPAPDPAYKQQPGRQPYDSIAGQLPFSTYIDFRDYVRYGYTTTFEDYKYLNETNARSHFSRYIGGAYREVQRLYDASREEMKRFILLDVLVNSLEVEGQALSWQDLHNPPAQAGYKLLPTQAAQQMPSFGEIVAYNRSSNDVNYVRWDLNKAARYYQANYARIFSLIMEYGPGKQDAWRLVHREISLAAGY
ncbi:MAG: hypothetical protein ACAI44_28990 [Candidatus Sericytochromatia bacterium]